MGGQPVWQREKDSNPHIRSQSPLCYLYTIPLNACAIILFFWTLSRAFSIFQEKFFVGVTMKCDRDRKKG